MEIPTNPKILVTSSDPAFPTWQLPFPLRLWHLASIDAPTVAVVWSMSFAWIAGIRLPFWVPVLLALVTWAVYVGDRLMDARRSAAPPVHFGQAARLVPAAVSRNSLRERHLFHWRHRRILLPLAAVAAVVAAFMVVALMPRRAQEHDTVLAAAALAYFSGIHARCRLPAWLPKELLVAVLFTAGCALPAWNRAPQLSLLIPVLFFAVLAWINCHAIERWESEEQPLAPGSVLFPGVLLGVVGVILATTFARSQPREAALLSAGAISSLSLAFLDRRHRSLAPLTLRTAADLVLLTPALIAPFAWLTR